MKDLSRHIEYLLCKHDSVVIPGLGAIETTYQPARFVAEENLYLPAVRTASLNTTRLHDDDHLLQDTLVKLHHVNARTASKWVSEYVADINQSLLETGHTDVGTIGRIVSHQGHTDFEPCIAGVDTPDLYGLDSFHFSKLPEEARRRSHHPENTHITIRIRRSVLSRVAAAVALIIVVLTLILPNYGNMTADRKYAKVVTTETIESIFAPVHTPTPQPRVVAPTPKAKPSAEQTIQTAQANAETEDEVRAEAKIETETESETEAKAEAKTDVSAPHGYCIVMASAITHNGAQLLIEKLRNEGVNNAVEYNDGKMIRVLLTGYHNEASARAQIEVVRAIDKMYSGTWLKYYN